MGRLHERLGWLLRVEFRSHFCELVVGVLVVFRDLQSTPVSWLCIEGLGDTRPDGKRSLSFRGAGDLL
jgi:hypothetical protein